MADDYVRIQDAVEEINTNADDLEQNGSIPFAQGARAMAIVIEQMPPADVEPVAYGRWVYVDDDDMRYDTYYCSECRNRITVDSYRRDDIGFTIDDMERCNKCGARMDTHEE